ncbi:MAG: hypothetical protein LQ342_006311 [Letrouitia transgressa]|nr:MAG: hypothetical protein LQ342_006311 [Letrouitia transgressa]
MEDFYRKVAATNERIRGAIGFQAQLEFLLACDKTALIQRMDDSYHISPRSTPSKQILDDVALDYLHHILNGWTYGTPTSPGEKAHQLVHVYSDEAMGAKNNGTRWLLQKAPCSSGSELSSLLDQSAQHFASVNMSHPIGVRLVSPKCNSSTHFNRFARALSKLLERLHGKETKKVHLGWTNDTCGLRLDFLPLDDMYPVDLLTLQNIVSTWATCEVEIERMQIGERSRALNLGLRRLVDDERFAKKDFREQVYSTKTIFDLRELLGYKYEGEPPAKLTIDYKNRTERKGKEKFTLVSFWEHSGTVEVERLLFWIEFVKDIVTSSHVLSMRTERFEPRIGPESFFNLLDRMIVRNHTREYCWKRIIATNDDKKSGERVRLAYQKMAEKHEPDPVD